MPQFKETVRLALVALLLPVTLLLNTHSHAAENPSVKIQTNHGDIILELYPDKAPKTVANFLQYVQDGFYTNTIFHRVIRDFMIQGGGFTPRFERKETRPPVINEADNGLKNQRGTIAMARTADPHSATAQFFINVVDNGFLDFTDKTPKGWGYTVFGRVTKGMEVVDTIRALQTGPGGPFARDVPQSSAIILGVTYLNKPKTAIEAPQAPVIQVQ
jgi:cyclophilin family peptidyl-prolyl cis-trans isomerase